MIKLNLGCNKTNFGQDWLHFDSNYHSHIIGHSITSLPFANETVDLIYASHVIEYFDRVEVIDVLNEWYRTLKKGAILRLAVPDFYEMAKEYVNAIEKNDFYHDLTLDNFLGPLYGRMFDGNKMIYHKTVYDFDSLNNVLRGIGFSNVCKYDWKTTFPHNIIDDQSHAYLPHDSKCIENLSWNDSYTLISLNVEATK